MCIRDSFSAATQSTRARPGRGHPCSPPPSEARGCVLPSSPHPDRSCLWVRKEGYAASCKSH
eukprot:9792512-Prorocentrum_lima.AAC.1